MLYRHAHHQRAATPVLSHLAGGVGIPLHKGNKACRCESGVFHRHPFRAQVRQVVSHAAATLHQLHLFLVDAYYAAITVGLSVQPDNEAVRQRADLKIIAYSRHRAALRHGIAEIAQQAVYFFLAQRRRIFSLHAGKLRGDTAVHIVRTFFIYIDERVFQGVFVHPDLSGEFVTAEVCQGSAERLLIRISCRFCHGLLCTDRLSRFKAQIWQFFR